MKSLMVSIDEKYQAQSIQDAHSIHKKIEKLYTFTDHKKIMISIHEIINHNINEYINQFDLILEMIDRNELNKLSDMIAKLSADGLIIHVNPLQEWYQPEGDTYKKSPLEVIEKVLATQIPVVVKEVGQGFGPRSIKNLLEMPIAGLELAGFGGTNFSKLEKLREKTPNLARENDLMFVGHTALEMIDQINLFNDVLNSNCLCKNIIISGGISSTLYGHWLCEKLTLPSVIGRAKAYLDHASNYEDLRTLVLGQIDTLKMANNFLVAK